MKSKQVSMKSKKALLALALSSTVAACAHAHDDKEGSHGHERGGKQKYMIALFGDMPYGALGKVQYPNLIADVNAANIEFSVFDGDLKSGGDGACTDDNLYFPALANFNLFKQPLILAIGDNDWTDCWGRYGASTTTEDTSDPIERLQHERELFFSTPYSLGQHKLLLTRQSGMYSQYVENARWRLGPVVYITLNMQGSNDNYPYAGVDGETRSQDEIERMRAEARARKAANIAWLDEGFAYAKRVGAKGVMVIAQADLNFNNEMHLADTRSWDAFPDYVNALRDAALAFPGQVAYVHGDSHYFKVDKPISGPKGGVVANFTRVETFGARNTHWVSATIDPENPNLFVFEPRMVPANIDAR
ncbi:MAG TPA: hypothetical protein VFM32_04900 [Spongiibacteraceae bacterium]|nr:hypothetical protein [Spongiibacteraceae bacterium]